MKYLFDTVDLNEIGTYMSCFPITGVTSNPSIIKKIGRIDFFPHMLKLRELIGKERSLHIQVTAPTAEGMLAEAAAIRERIDDKVYIKVPVNEEGLKAIRALKKDGYPVTATGIYTKVQALMSLECGADYLAMYYNRMENADIDPVDAISTVAMMIDRYGYQSEILGASFKNMAQVNHAFEAGAQAVTVAPAILHDAFQMPAIKKAVDDFASDWKSIFGEKTIAEL